MTAGNQDKQENTDLQKAETAEPVLVVDLDGTLIKSDLMQEAASRFVAQNPLNLFRLPIWLLRGRAHLKARLAVCAPPPQAEHLPYNEAFLNYLRCQKRPLVLATAAHQTHANIIAEHCRLFDAVLATTADENLRGQAKAKKLAELYGDKNFDYAGNGRADLPVWERARRVIMVNAPVGIRARHPEALCFDNPKPRWRVWLRAIRLHQWAKNALLFVAVVGGHQVLSPAAMSASFLAFLVFGLLASATYLLNDIIDLTHDRQHPLKRLRPLAGGDIGVFAAVVMAMGMFLAALLLLPMLPMAFAFVAGAYVVATFAYSLKLKRLLFLDILVLSLLFTLRIIAGGAATGIELSFWLQTFSVFIFLSLASLKRYGELSVAISANRAYQPTDIPFIAMLGTAAGIASVFVLALYMDSDIVKSRYDHPQWLWLALPLFLYWISRLWLLGGRGVIVGDPLLYALRDKTSWGAAVLLFLLMYLAA